MDNPEHLYVLRDGTHADPAECEKDKNGVLKHKNGVAVALYEDGSPQTVGKDAVVNKNVEAAEAGKIAEAKADAAKLQQQKATEEARATHERRAGAANPAPVTEVKPKP